MKLIPVMNFESVSGIKGNQRKCSVCGKLVKGGYHIQCATDKEFEIMDGYLKGEVENWLVCEECLGGYCQDPAGWLSKITQERLKFDT